MKKLLTIILFGIVLGLFLTIGGYIPKIATIIQNGNYVLTFIPLEYRIVLSVLIGITIIKIGKSELKGI